MKQGWIWVVQTRERKGEIQELWRVEEQHLPKYRSFRKHSFVEMVHDFTWTCFKDSQENVRRPSRLSCFFPVSFTSVAAIKCLLDAAEGRQWHLFSHNSRLQSITMGKSGRELQIAGYITSLAKSREKWILTSTAHLLGWLHLYNSGTLVRGWRCPQWARSSHIN